MWERSVQWVMQAAREMRSRRALVYLVLTAFVLQGLVTQGHMHFVASAQKVFAAQHSVSGVTLDAKADTPVKPSPRERDDSNCPICHAASRLSATLTRAGLRQRAHPFHLQLTSTPIFGVCSNGKTLMP